MDQKVPALHGAGLLMAIMLAVALRKGSWASALTHAKARCLGRPMTLPDGTTHDRTCRHSTHALGSKEEHAILQICCEWASG